MRYDPLVIDPPTAAAVGALRQKYGLTQRELAGLAGMHTNTLARCERGERHLSGACWALALLALGEHPRGRLR